MAEISGLSNSEVADLCKPVDPATKVQFNIFYETPISPAIGKKHNRIHYDFTGFFVPTNDVSHQRPASIFAILHGRFGNDIVAEARF